ncbi:MAG: ABC transporter ATP-binding protein [Candidatus Pacebacteria bacterium]|nr:ABC transporter ATP-binding protein [Candidatus Paceibacterota bacterium]MBP9843001.1 ABC transporter ATP-binding protein [Candidatus Paceibacterota bacterium]
MSIIIGKNLKRRFGSGDLVTHVLRGIDVTIEEGEFVAIMGKSGAGKSTLMYQLSILDEPSEGELIIDGKDVLSFDEVERTAFRLNTLGYVFQDYALVPDLSTEENVMIPLLMRGLTWEGAKQKARQSIDEVGMVGKYLNLPSELSGGEQQRAAIARAIAGKPRILFADEPTANLDTTFGTQIIELITALNRDYGQTVVMVTHEREYALGCNRIIHMEDGLVVNIEHLR